MKPSQLLQQHREEVLRLSIQFGIRNLRIFGSVARGEDVEGSDLDLLVAFPESASLFDALKFQERLEQLLGLHVEVATEAGLHPLIRERVLREACVLQ